MDFVISLMTSVCVCVCVMCVRGLIDRLIGFAIKYNNFPGDRYDTNVWSSGWPN